MSDPGSPPSKAPVKTSDKGSPPWNSSSAPDATDAAPIVSMATASKANHHHPAMNLGWVLATSQVRKVQKMARPTEAQTIHISGGGSCQHGHRDQDQHPDQTEEAKDDDHPSQSRLEIGAAPLGETAHFPGN